MKFFNAALVLMTVSPSVFGNDLMDTYLDALANDPVLSRSEAKRLSASEDTSQARALLLPQVQGAASWGRSDSNDFAPLSGGNGNDWDRSSRSQSRSVTITMRQRIFDLGKRADLSEAKSKAASQNANYRAALQNLYVRTTAAYFEVLTKTDQLTFAKANEEAFRQAYEQTDQRFMAGLSAITDTYQAKSVYEHAKAQTIQAENKLHDAREALTQITGKSTGALKKLREDIPMDAPSPADPQAWLRLAWEHNQAIAAQQHSLEATEHASRSAQAEHLPTLDASLSYSKSAQWAATSGGRPDTASFGTRSGSTKGWTVGINLKIPIFAGGATQAKIRQSVYNREKAQNGLEEQRRKAVRDTLNFYRIAIAGMAAVKAAKASVEAGQEALKATRAGFDIGKQTMPNMLSAIQNLTRAQSNYSQSRHNLLLNGLRLKQAAGTLERRDIEAINTLLW
ncbi:MAG TPA: TolC family outer membrane protein [Dyella sp.]